MLVLYLVLMLITEYLVYIFGEIKKSNHIILPFYSLAELLFFSFFYRLFYLKKQFNKFFLLPVLVAVVFIIGEFLFNFILNESDPHSYQPFSKIADNILVLGFAFTSLSTQMFNSEQFNIKSFWFNVVLILYFTINTLVFLPFNFMVNAPLKAKFFFWILHTLAVIGFYGFLSTIITKHAFNKNR